MSNAVWLPIGYNWRELWEARNIVGTKIPSSVAGGNAMTITGGTKGISCEGVKFTGAADSNINCGAIYNAGAKLWISLRFKLSSSFAAGAPSDQNLWGKFLTGNDFLYCKLGSADGKLVFGKQTGGVSSFALNTTQVSWSANTWYHLLISISSVNGARLIINGGTAVTSADTTAAPNGGDVVFGDYDDPGAGTGFKGVLSDIIVGTDDLTTAEEQCLYYGFSPSDAVNRYTLTTGYGTTAYDRGSGANNGTLDAAASWAPNNPNLPIWSPDGLNDEAVTAANVCDITRPLTLVWVGKLASYSDGTYQPATMIFHLKADGNNYAYINGRSTHKLNACYNATSGAYLDQLTQNSWGQYTAIVVPVNPTVISLYENGVLCDTDVTPGNAVGLATVKLSSNVSAAQPDPSPCIMAGVVNGALTAPEVQKLTSVLRNHYGF